MNSLPPARPQLPIHLDIDQLVLHGFKPADRHRIGDVVERELGQLLAEQGTSAKDAEIPQLSGEFHYPCDAGAEYIGAQIAKTVHAAVR